jgi:hypothetical protein
MADPDLIQQRVNELDKIDRVYHEALRACVGHFWRGENPPQPLIDSAADLQQRLDAIRAEIQALLGALG